MDFSEIFLLLIVGLISGMVNTVSGGGSLLTLPILIFIGLPPNVANGTNRVVIVAQSLSGSIGYSSKGIYSYPFNIYLGISASIGAYIGAKIALNIDGEIFNKILAVIIIIVGALIFIQKKKLTNFVYERTTGKYLWFSMLVFFVFGIYGGFINAGIGILIMLFLNRLNQMSLVKSNATKVSVVFIYSLFALLIFAYNNSIDWKMGISMATGSIFGAWFASRWSVKKGDNLIRHAVIISTAIISIKLWFF